MTVTEAPGRPTSWTSRRPATRPASSEATGGERSPSTAASRSRTARSAPWSTSCSGGASPRGWTPTASCSPELEVVRRPSKEKLSLDGPAATHDRTRGDGSSRRALAGPRRRATRGRRSSSPASSVATTATRSTSRWTSWTRSGFASAPRRRGPACLQGAIATAPTTSSTARGAAPPSRGSSRRRAAATWCSAAGSATRGVRAWT